MTLPLNLTAASRILPASQKDRRRHKRVDIGLTGRYLDEFSKDHALKTTNLSCSGAMISCETKPEVEASIVCYFDELGRVAAQVIRATPDGFAVRFKTSAHKRDKIADQLTWLLNRERLNLHEDRKSDRFPAGGPALIERKDGRQMQCRVVDISLTGASFATEGPVPLVGEQVATGNLKGEVVRSQPGKFAIRYLHD